MAYKAVVVGASGLIGKKLLSILWQWPEYDEVISLGRKKVNLKNKKLTQYVVDFDHLENYAEHINGRVVFCCLGTTRDKTLDPNEYKVMDHDYPIKLAEIARKNNVEQFHFVSSIGANKDSSNFHLKLKGETEESLREIGLDCLHIYQPSLLTGHRNDAKFVEELSMFMMKIINPLLIGPLTKYRSIPAFTVAMAMFKQSLKNKEGVFIHSSDKIKRLT